MFFRTLTAPFEILNCFEVGIVYTPGFRFCRYDR
jgi:hypothetical protein